MSRVGTLSGFQGSRCRESLPAIVAFFVLLQLGAPPAARADFDDPFLVETLESVGRTVMAEFADIDGDGRTDVIQAVTFGMPPVERRFVRVHVQSADGAIPARATLELPIPTQSAAYDLADVLPTPGVELLLLRPRGVDVVSFDRDESGALQGRTTEMRLPTQRTIGVTSDERGLDRLSMTTSALGEETVLVVPGLSEIFLLSNTGELLAEIESGSRGNYFVEPPGFMLGESEIQIFLDAPRLSIGDCNGNGRVDLLVTTRHELLVFHQREEGGFDGAASERTALGRVSLADHIRGSGTVRTAGRDVDGDGLLDLILSETRGGLMDANTNTYIYYNRGGGWDLDAPDHTFSSGAALSADHLVDIDGDGKLELLHAEIPISVLELIEMFLTAAIDANLSVHGLDRDARAATRAATQTTAQTTAQTTTQTTAQTTTQTTAQTTTRESAAEAKPSAEEQAWFEVKLGIPLDFETSRPAGFMPSASQDWNGDGFTDYITSTDGTKIEIYLGSRERGWRKRSAEQDVSTEGQLRTGDLNADGLTDGILFNTRRMDQPLKLLTNRGMLPGTQPSMRAQ